MRCAACMRLPPSVSTYVSICMRVEWAGVGACPRRARVFLLQYTRMHACVCVCARACMRACVPECDYQLLYHFFDMKKLSCA